MTDMFTSITHQIDAVRQCGGTVLVAIEGRCASGKSTLAAQLSEHYNCPLIHMDEFFLRPEQRTPSRYAVPGENIDHERFLEEVLLPLRRGQAASYRPFDCQTQQLTSAITLPAAPLYLIEGSYSCHPALRSHYDLRLFLTVEPEEQLRRITKRNGPDYAQVVRNRWIPLEEAYFSACDVENCCDSVYFT